MLDVTIALRAARGLLDGGSVKGHSGNSSHADAAVKILG